MGFNSGFKGLNGSTLLPSALVFISRYFEHISGHDCSVGIATRYGLDGSRQGDEISLTRVDRPWGPPSLLYKGYRVFPGAKGAGEWR